MTLLPALTNTTILFVGTAFMPKCIMNLPPLCAIKGHQQSLYNARGFVHAFEYPTEWKLINVTAGRCDNVLLNNFLLIITLPLARRLRFIIEVKADFKWCRCLAADHDLKSVPLYNNRLGRKKSVPLDCHKFTALPIILVCRETK